MQPRQRVLATIEHQEPDRVPLALWGSAYGITDPLYFRLIEYLGLGEPVAPFRERRGHSVNYYDDRVLEALGVDVRYVWCGFTDLAGPPAGGGLDAWGIGWKQSGLYLSPVENPLAEAGLREIEMYPFPQGKAFMRLEEMRQRAIYLRNETDCAVVGRAVDSYGLLERSSQLRGYGNLMMDLAMNPDVVDTLVGRVVEVLSEMLNLYLDAAGAYIDIIELPGDDYAAQNPLISPQMFDRFFAAGWRKLINIVRSKAPHVKIMFHSDGRMEPFLGRLIDLGVDIFHCLEPLPGVDMAAIKQQYGGELCFWGAIDIKQALRGDVSRVREEVQQRIQTLALGGGYVLAPANHLQPDVPPENVVALYQFARELGVYS